MSKPPYIDTQGLRLWNRPAGEFFGGGPEQDTASESLRRRERWRADGSEDSQDDPAWLAITRENLVKGEVSLPEEDRRSLRRVVVVVDSGRGKTTLLRRLALEFGKDSEFNVRLMVPVRLLVNDLMPTSDQHWPTDEEILQRIGESLRKSNDALADELGSDTASNRKMIAWLRQMREKGRLILLVDALDQSAGPQIETLRRMLSGELTEWNSCRFILTGRPPAVSYFNEVTRLIENPGNGWQIVRLEPFTIAEQQKFVGSERWHKIPPEARLLLDTPRVCEYVQDLTDEKCEKLKTVSDVYYLSLRRMISYGLKAEVAQQFGPGRKVQPLPIGSSGEPALEADPEQIAAAYCLLSAIAFKLICLPNPGTHNLRNKIETTTEYDSVMKSVHDRVRDHPCCGWADDRKFRDDVERLRAVNATELDFWFFDNGFEQTKELWFRDATIKEFLAAYWCSKHGTETENDTQRIKKWIYLPDRPTKNEDTNAQYRWFWRYLCEMPNAGRKAESWLRCIEPLYQPSDGTAEGTHRSCEMMYRAWPTITAYRDQEDERALETVGAFLGEFQKILNSAELARAKIAAQLVPDHVLRPLLSRQRFEQIRPPSHEPAFVRCPPLEWEKKEHAQRGIGPDEPLACHCFWMGTDEGTDLYDRVEFMIDCEELLVRADEFPRHQVRLTPFFCQATTVSREQFKLFDASHDVTWEAQFALTAPTSDCPVTKVSWYDSWCFALWCGLSLPTEAQWEFAARAGKDGERDFYPTGGFITSLEANFDGIRGWLEWHHGGPFLGKTVPVRSRQPPHTFCGFGTNSIGAKIEYQQNAFGLFHPVGNVWEWCIDWYDSHEYRRRVTGAHKNAVVDPQGPTNGFSRICRGGTWHNNFRFCRSAKRNGQRYFRGANDLGFRLVCVVSCERTS